MWLSLTLEVQYIMLYTDKLVKISSDTQILKFHTVLYRCSKRIWLVLALFFQQN